jgi:ABC-type molybdenum transport system ATPase subunit/photorepair protein PhrA
MVAIKRKRAPQGRYLAVDLVHIDLMRGARHLLRDLCWRIRPGQRWALQGASGAGKTQLLKLIAGDVWPQPHRRARRSYLWRGELSTEPYGVKDEIAYLGAERQDRYQHYDWNYCVRTIVGTGLQRSDTPQRSLRFAEQARITRVLRQLGILPLARRRLLTLSQGERRLVLLARALAWRPALLLLDEPLNGLDERNRARVLAAPVIDPRRYRRP